MGEKQRHTCYVCHKRRICVSVEVFGGMDDAENGVDGKAVFVCLQCEEDTRP